MNRAMVTIFSRLVWGLLILGPSLQAGNARAETPAMMIALAENHVDITTGFTGSRVVVFGVKEVPGDIAVTILGPMKEAVVWRKEPVVGLWVNRGAVRFHSVPAYYDYALSRRETRLADPDALRASSIGLDALRFEPASYDDPQRTAKFQEGLIRNRQSRGLFPLEPRPVEFVNDRFFKAVFNLPANVPTGDYTVHAFLIRDGRVEEADRAVLSVSQVGFSARIFNFAWADGLAYGLCGVFLALMAGTAAHVILRRD